MNPRSIDKKQAQKLIKKTFESSFDKSGFTNFIKNLLNRIDDASFSYQGNYIPDAYKQYIKTLERIGKFSDGENHIDILVITLQKDTSLERARTMQRNFVAWYLNGSRGGERKDAALVAYVSPDQAEWRFSLVKMDYRFEKTKSGKVKVKEEFTPARRWSFLVGANEKSHTVQSRLVKILADDEHAPTLAELEQAFDIETVTKEFFLKYRELFLRTKEALDKVVKTDSKIKADFQAKGVDTVNFAKKLLGQIVFLYFLQKKGWFGVGRDDDWGTGSKHFLRDLFRGKHGSFDNFFNDILEPLFYEALRIDRSHDDDYYSRFNCKIPFLNGGLFDPIGNYDWVHTDINLPDDLFSNSRKTKEGDEGDGILDVFDRYNFTVREDEPLEKEVAIDPELIGKAYEKFNAIRPDNFDEFTKALKSGKKGEENKFNKKFGVYYTPREIVHYMCQQSLINYLNSELNSESSSYQKLGDSQLDMFGNKAKKGQLDLTIEHKAGISIRKEDIETLIHAGEQFSENEARVLRKGKETKTYTHQLPESIRKHAALIDQKLADITVCDPAVGSGAFPVGMMNEIVRARNVLSVFLNNQERSDYEFKRRCIEHSLYGVDIDPGAVEIAKLRLWLSLVVDEEDIKNIKPLPNLDYKIVCGNSLLGVEKDLFNYQLFDELEKLKPLFFSETNPTKKQEFKKQIDDLISQITKGHTEFDFEVYFSEVFHAKGGFDVVIGNPPYGYRQIHNAKSKAYFKQHYMSANASYENYFLFYEASLRLLDQGGVQTFIAPVTWLTIPSAKSLRKFILNDYSIYEICWLSEEAFENANVNTLISIIQYTNMSTADYSRVKFFETLAQFPSRPSSGQNISQKQCIKNDHYISIFSNTEELALLEKLRSKSKPLVEFAKPCSGYNPYEIGKGSAPEGGPHTANTVKEKPYHSNKQKGGDWKPEIVGRDLYRYGVKITGERWIKYGPWLAAQRDPNNFKGRRILVQEITGGPKRRIVATYYDGELYHSRDVIPILMNDVNLHPYYILGVINSWLMSWYHQKCNPKANKGLFPKVLVSDLKKLPLYPATTNEQEKIKELVSKILTIKRHDDVADTTELEQEIDQLVYKFYGLTGEEIRIVEGEGK